MAVTGWDLATVQLEYYKHYLITVTNKVTDMEYTKKIGFLSRVNTKISLAIWYREFLELIADILKGVIKVWKEMVYQKGYESRVLAIYCILLRSEKVD